MVEALDLLEFEIAEIQKELPFSPNDWSDIQLENFWILRGKQKN